jgi:hypothetical protein
MIMRKPNFQLEDQYSQQGSCCYYCKEKVPFEFITRDHFNPVSKGNTLVNNKVFACRKCNSIKGDNNIVEFHETIRFRIKKSLHRFSIKNYDISQDDIRKLNRYRKIYNTIREIQSNDNKPSLIFT